MMAVDESDSRGVWLFLVCNFSLASFTVLHFSSVFILARGGSISPQCISATTWYQHESEPHQLMLCLKINIKPHLLHVSSCCTSFLYCFNPFLGHAATDPHAITWTPPGNVKFPLALPASVTALSLLIPLWVISPIDGEPSGDRNCAYGLWISRASSTN